MKRNKLVAFIILVIGLLASSVAWAHGGGRAGFVGHPGFHGSFHHHGHHGHFHRGAAVGVVIGAPLVWPGYYYRPWPPPAYYVYPPVVAAPASPPVYIEQGSTDSGSDIQQQPGYWYYCSDPQGYYPYVKVCPGGWQQVPAQPPPNAPRP